MHFKTEFSQDPIRQFKDWFAIATEHPDIDKAEAFCLSTLSENGYPQGRIVLMKQVTYDGFVFYTNYKSQKARDLDFSDKASMCFFWDPLGFQVRVRGTVTKVSDSLSEDYCASRTRESQIGAWASEQSEVIEDRSVLENAYADYEERFKDAPVPRPPHWGGYLITPVEMEFWINQEDRLHDRFLYRKESDEWTIHRLAP